MPGSTANDAWPPPLELGLRLILGYGLAIWLAHSFGRDLVEAVLPLLRNLIVSLDDAGYVFWIGIINSGADTMLRMRAHLPHDLSVDGRHFSAADHVLSPSVGIGLILQPSVVASGLLLAWPVRRLSEYPLRFAGATAMLFLILVADAPLTLWANYSRIVSGNAFSLLWLWEEFLVNGGRLASGLVIALVAIRMGDRLARRWARQVAPVG